MKIVGQFLIGVIYLAIVYTLVRPGSPAATVIKTTSNALVGVVGSTTGYNTFGGIKLS